jgi:ABC-type nitrate/sulfonate/bicarbonate transport system substrate-binding protein
LPIAPDASFFVAVEEGYFRTHGLSIEPVRLQSSNQALEALAAGRVDALAPVALEAALALEVTSPGEFRIVEMTAATAETRVHRILVRTDSTVQSLADLRGKNFGTFPGSQMTVFLKLILGRYFDAEQDLTITQLRPNLQPQALLTGQVDALFCLEPTCSQLEQAGDARAISVNPLYKFILQPFPTAVGIVSARFAQQSPETVRDIQAALVEAHALVRTAPERARSTLPIYTPIAADVAPHVGLYDYWDVAQVDQTAVRALVQLYVEHGIIGHTVDVAPLLFTSEAP